ncbi:MAG: hypothetical protein ACR2LH_08600 [Thermoleophilaceae bacterium]
MAPTQPAPRSHAAGVPGEESVRLTVVGAGRLGTALGRGVLA